jgi:hypothetical protein
VSFVEYPVKLPSTKLESNFKVANEYVFPLPLLITSTDTLFPVTVHTGLISEVAKVLEFCVVVSEAYPYKVSYSTFDFNV